MADQTKLVWDHNPAFGDMTLKTESGVELANVRPSQKVENDPECKMGYTMSTKALGGHKFETNPRDWNLTKAACIARCEHHGQKVLEQAARLNQGQPVQDINGGQPMTEPVAAGQDQHDQGLEQ